jgi:hypothetical protein
MDFHLLLHVGLPQHLHFAEWGICATESNNLHIRNVSISDEMAWPPNLAPWQNSPGPYTACGDANRIVTEQTWMHGAAGVMMHLGLLSFNQTTVMVLSIIFSLWPRAECSQMSCFTVQLFNAKMWFEQERPCIPDVHRKKAYTKACESWQINKNREKGRISHFRPWLQHSGNRFSKQ